MHSARPFRPAAALRRLSPLRLRAFCLLLLFLVTAGLGSRRAAAQTSPPPATPPASDQQNANLLDDAWEAAHGFELPAFRFSSLAGWWLFDDRTATDRSAFHLDGTLQGFTGLSLTPPVSPFLSGGLFYGALSFDERAFVAFDPAKGPNLSGGSFTLSAWFKAPAPAQGTTPNPSVIAHWVGLNGASWELGVDGRSAAYLDLTSAAASAPTQRVDKVTAPTVVRDGAWHHLAGVYDAQSSTATLYVNGSPEAAGAISGWTGANVLSFRLGFPGPAGAATPNAAFTLDEVRLYNLALGAGDIKQLPPTFYDLDADGLSTWQEMQAGTDPSAADSDGDGVPDGQDLYPLDFYNHALPTLILVSGDGQSGAKGAFLAQALTVKVTNAAGQALASAPVVFTVASGDDGRLALAFGANPPPAGAAGASVTARTDASGVARAFLFLPADTTLNAHRVNASATISGGQSAAVAFNASVRSVAPVSSGLQLWLKADQGITQDSGGLVSRWSDQSGAGNDATQASAGAQPTLVPSLTNGLPAVRFNGGNASLGLPDFMSAFTEGEIFLVQRSAGTGSWTGYHHLGSGGYSGHYPHYGTIYDDFGSTTRYNAGQPTVPLDQFHLYGVQSRPGAWTDRLNGQTLFSSATNTVAFPSNPDLGASYYYGHFFAGDVAEVLFYNRALSSSERRSVEIYLAGRYALPLRAAAPTISPAGGVLIQATPVSVATPDAGATIHYTLDGSEPTEASPAYSTPITVSGTLTLKAKAFVPSLSPSDPASASFVFDPGAAGLPAPADLRLWLRADTGVTTDSSGKVSAWSDLSGANNSAAQADVNSQPLRVDGQLNGKPILRFDGNTGKLVVPTSPGTDDFTIFAVARTAATHEIDPESSTSTSGVSGQHYLFGAKSDPDAGAGVSLGTNGVSVYEHADSYLPPLAVYAGPVGSGFNSVAVRYTAKQPQVFLNGALVRTGLASPRAHVRAPVEIGAGLYGAFPGDVAEVLVYNRALSESERQQVEAYLNAKYAYNPPPAAPAQVSATPLSASQVMLSWTQGSGGGGATGYTVERQAVGGAWTTLASVGAGQSSYLDASAGAGTAYAYRVTAANTTGSSPASTAASATTPASGAALPVTGLQLWLRADAGVSVDANNKVSAWADQSSSGNSAAQPSAPNAPLLVGGVLNGRPVLRFDGASTSLHGPMSLGAQVSVFAVASAGPNTDYKRLLTNEVNLFFGTRDNVQFTSFYGNGGGWGTSQSHPAALIPGQFNLLTSINDGFDNAYVNGHLVDRRQNPMAPFDDGLEIGRYPGGSQYWDGDVAEVLIYNRALSDAERQAVESYLNGKYAVVPAPAQPTGLSAAAISSTQANLFWNTATAASAQIQGYSIERKEAGAPASAFVEVAAVAGGGAQAYLDENLSPGASYAYRVRSYNLAGYSAYSNESTVVLPAAAANTATLPATLDLALWLRPEAGVTKDANGLVSGWTDASGHGHNAGAADAPSRPQWVDAVLNGRPVLRFDGNANSLSIPDPVLASAGNATLLVVASVPDTAMHGQLVKLGSGYSGFGFGTGGTYIDYPGNDAIGIYEGVRWINTGKPLGTGPLLAEMSVDGSGTATFYRNGESLGAYPGQAPIPPATSTLIGGQLPRMFRGDIAEVVVFDRVLTDAERRAWGAYLNAKYNYDPPPPAPTQVAATPLSATQASLSWVDTFQNIDGYRVERQNADGTWSLFTTLGAGTTSYLLTGLSPGTPYVFRIVATNRTGDSPVAMASLTTPASGQEMPLANLRLWLRADSGSVTDGNGGVGQWLDRSGHDNHAQQTGGRTPHLATDQATGYPVLRFDGTSSEMGLPNFMANAGAGELFIVHRATANPNGADAQGWHDFGADNGYFTKRYPAGDGRILENFGTNSSRDTGAAAVALDHLHLYDALSQSGEWTSRLNGVLHATSKDNTVAFSPAPRLGVDGVYNQHFAGDVAEILVFDRALSAPEREAVSRYLTNRYNLVPVPVAPSGVQAVAVSASQVNLSWTQTMQVNGTVIYSLERQVGGSAFVPAGEVQDATSFLDTGLLPGTTYSYRLTARGYAGAATGSTMVSVATLPSTSVEAAAMPTDSVRLWLKADTGLSIGGINTWSDQSGQSNHARQTFATSQPQVQRDVLNHRPVVHFNGTTTEMGLPNLMDGAAEGEVFIVHRATTNPNGAGAQGWHDFGVDNGYGVKHYPADDGQVYDSFGSTGLQYTGKPTAHLDQFHLYDAASKAGEWTSRINGLRHYTATGNSVGFNGSPRLGVNSVYNYHFAGDVAEVLVYSRVLSEIERQAVDRYFNAKYALVSAVPTVPTAVSAQAISSTQATLFWQEVSGGTGSVIYTIERRGPSGNYVLVGQVADVTSFVDAGLTPGGTYTYRITAHNWAGDSDTSQEVSTALPAANPYLTDMPTTGLKLWLRADAGVNAGGMNIWPDQSGNGNHAHQGSASNQPTLVPNVLNGRPVARFDGQNSSMDLPGFLNGFAQGEIFVVHRTIPPAGGGDCGWHDFGNDNGYGVKYYTAGDGRIYDGFGTNVRKDTGAPSQPVTQFHLYDAASKPGEWTSRINGALHYTTPDNTVGFNGSPRLGVDSVYNVHFKGDIAELLVYDHVLTEAERNAVGQYLDAKYQFVPAPTPPTALATTAISPTQVSLTWTANFGNALTYYEVERKGTQDADFAPVAAIAQSASYIDTSLTPGAAYTYRVRARNYAGYSPYSDPSSVTLFAAGQGAEMPLGGVRIWLKADAGVGASSVVNWVDQSGHGSHAHQNAASAQPKLATQAANGRPAVQFDGQQSAMYLPNVMNGCGAGEMFVIHRSTADATADNGWHDFGNDNGYGVKYYTAGDGRIYDGFGTNVRKDTGAPAFPVSQWHLYDVASQPGEWTSRINGFVHFTTTDNTVGFNGSPRLGLDSVYNRYFKGEIAELLVYDHALSAGERETVGRYLLTKYALAIVPAPPAGGVASVVSSTQTALTWGAVGNGNYSVIYTIERQGPDGMWSVVAQVTDLTSFLDSGLQPGVTYKYRITARNGVGTSGSSQEFSVTTPASADPNATAMPTTGLRLWLRADAGLGADGVNTWPDQSGLGNHARQNSRVNLPMLVQNAVNGRPVVHFDGQNSELYLPNYMDGATAGELFIVHRSTAAADANNGWHDLGNDNGYGVKYFLLSDGRIYDDFGTNVRKDTGAPVLPVDQFHLYNVVSRSGEWTSRLNGGIHYQTGDNTVGFPSGSRLGASSVYNQHFQGDIAEVLVYDHALSDAEREAVGRYLNDKYAMESVPAAPAAPTSAYLPAAYPISPTQVSVTWSETSAATAQGSVIYMVERKPASAPSSTYAEVGTVTDGTSFLDGSCSPDTVYTYRVRARNYAGISGYGPEFTVSVPAGPLGNLLPTGDLKLWLKADAGIGPDGLNTWFDQSGNNNHAWQINKTGLPIKKENVANGRPVVRFDGQNNELYFRDFLSSLPKGELFIVHRSRADAGVANGWHDLGNDNGYGVKYYPYSDGRIYDSFGSNVRKDPPNAARPDLRAFHLYNAQSSAEGWTSEIDENAQYSTSSNTVAFPSHPRLGASSVYNVHFQGDIAEVLIFNRVLTPTERHHVEIYLGAKYFLAGIDSDDDGLTNGQEAALGTNPFNADSNGDGLSDGTSVRLGIDPLGRGGFNYHTLPDPAGGTGGPGVDPNDHTPPAITLTAPANAVPLP